MLFNESLPAKVAFVRHTDVLYKRKTVLFQPIQSLFRHNFNHADCRLIFACFCYTFIRKYY